MTTPQGDLPDYLPAVGATVGVPFSGIIPGNGSETVPLSQYNSVLICAISSPFGTPVGLSYTWFDSIIGGGVDFGLLSANVTTLPPGSNGPSWLLPVRASQLVLTNTTATAIAVSILGQPSYADWQMLQAADPARPFTTLIPASAAANAAFAFASTLPVADTIPIYPGVTSYNGEVTLTLTTAAGTNGAVEAVWPDQHGNLITTPLLIDPGGGSRSQLVTHPRAYCTWQYRLSAAAPAVAHNAILSITPG